MFNGRKKKLRTSPLRFERNSRVFAAEIIKELMKMKTYMANAQTVERKWYVVDAEGMPLGRLASKVAAILRGKNKPTFTPNVDTGDFVIVVNCPRTA